MNFLSFFFLKHSIESKNVKEQFIEKINSKINQKIVDNDFLEYSVESLELVYGIYKVNFRSEKIIIDSYNSREKIINSFVLEIDTKIRVDLDKLNEKIAGVISKDNSYILCIICVDDSTLNFNSVNFYSIAGEDKQKYIRNLRSHFQNTNFRKYIVHYVDPKYIIENSESIIHDFRNSHWNIIYKYKFKGLTRLLKIEVDKKESACLVKHWYLKNDRIFFGLENNVKKFIEKYLINPRILNLENPFFNQKIELLKYCLLKYHNSKKSSFSRPSNLITRSNFRIYEPLEENQDISPKLLKKAQRKLDKIESLSEFLTILDLILFSPLLEEIVIDIFKNYFSPSYKLFRAFLKDMKIYIKDKPFDMLNDSLTVKNICERIRNYRSEIKVRVLYNLLIFIYLNILKKIDFDFRYLLNLFTLLNNEKVFKCQNKIILDDVSRLLKEQLQQ